jgi:hypothetical protein
VANSPNTAHLRGPWVSGTSYIAADVVSYEGYSYECIQATSSVTPGGDGGTYWVVVSDEPGDADPVGKFLELNEAAYSAVYGDEIMATVNCTITLPAPQAGAKVIVWSNGASITATVEPTAPVTVNGTTSVTVTTQYTKKTFVSDGVNWFAA